MIKGKIMKEMNTISRIDVNYRELSSLNSSMLKLFDSDPVKFYEQFKLGRKGRDKESTSMSIGDIVDFYILECKGSEEEFEQRYDEKFALFNDNKGTGQVFILADILFKIRQENVDKNGNITASFDTLFEEGFKKVCNLGKYNGKSKEDALKDFNKNGYAYFQTLVENEGKTVVDISVIDKAKKVARGIMDDSFIGNLFDGDGEVEYLPKFPIEWNYTLRSGKIVSCKSELDVLKLDHSTKMIYLGDLKTTFDNENFEFTYLKHKYYIQAAFYHLAVKDWAKNNGFEDYTILPMEFIVGDTSSNNRRPIRYQMTDIDLDMALRGFTLRGTEHKGVHQLMEEICWAEDNDMWNCSKDLVDNDGILTLKLKYD